MTKRDINNLPAYQEWYATQSFKKYSSAQIKNYDDEIKSLIQVELNLFNKMNVSEYTLWHKYNEIKEWLPKQNKGEIERVKRLIWKPQGISDFRRIEPELIYVNAGYEMQKINIWGEKKLSVLNNDEPLLKQWQIISTLVSSARNDGVVGRSLRFLVRDKKTKTYLGVICIASEMPYLKPRNDAIGWDLEKQFSSGGKIENLANGQAIVPTQPFGTAFLGGKLLSLLCLSDEVSKTWQEMYGNKLVGVGTTSLYGDKVVGSQYDNLNPYWTTLSGVTSGNTPYKLPDDVFFKMRDWMRQRYPEDFWRHFEEKKSNGLLNMRDNKNRAMEFCYRKLKFKSDYWFSGHTRGVHFSRLYKNTDEFLRDEIEESELIPAFDNSIEALTEFWRFGSIGDTTKPTQEIIDKTPTKRISKKIEMKGQVKGRIDSKRKRASEGGCKFEIPTQGSAVDWYEELATMSWDEVLMKFGNQVGR